MKRTWAFAFTYTGAILGAGFFSGREIWYFFAKNSFFGFYGVIVTAIFFVFVAPILFLSGKGLNIDNYHQIFYKFLPRFLAITFDIIFAFFFLGSFAVMLTGSGALLEESFDIYYFFGVIITLFIIFITLILKVEGMYKINSYFIPFILIITLLVIIRFIPEISLSFIKGVLLEKINLGGGKTIWLRDAVLYGTYNLSMASGVMIGIAVNEKKRTVIRGSIFGE